MTKEESNDYRSNIDRNVTVGTVAYIDGSVISHTLAYTLPSYGNPRDISRDPLIGGKITRIQERRTGISNSS
jgi:hypothetical protein